MATNDNGQRIAAVETKMSAVEKALDRQTDALADVAKALHEIALRTVGMDDLEQRMRRLEAREAKLLGIMVALGAVGPYILPKLIALLGSGS